MSSRREERHIRRFTAVSQEGETFDINESQTFINAGSHSGVDWLPGMKRMQTSRGEAVNRLDQGKYQVVRGPGKIDVTSDDPTAP